MLRTVCVSVLASLGLVLCSCEKQPADKPSAAPATPAAKPAEQSAAKPIKAPEGVHIEKLTSKPDLKPAHPPVATTRAAGSQPAGSATSAPQSKPADDRAEREKEGLARLVSQLYELYKNRYLNEMDHADGLLTEQRNLLASAAEDAKPEIERRIKDVEAKMAVARERFNILAGATVDTWNDLKRDVDAAINDVRVALGEKPMEPPKPANESTKGAASRPEATTTQPKRP